MTKCGMAHEKHDHKPPEWACGSTLTQPCGRQHQCCFLCEIFYRCQEGRCMAAWFAMKTQPNPRPFSCSRAKTLSEIVWEMVFNGSFY